VTVDTDGGGHQLTGLCVERGGDIHGVWGRGVTGEGFFYYPGCFGRAEGERKRSEARRVAQRLRDGAALTGAAQPTGRQWRMRKRERRTEYAPKNEMPGHTTRTAK